MTGPELDQDLEAIGRRISPRAGAAHDAVVARAGSGRPPRTAPPWPGRLGGAALTLAFTAGFAALLAVGVADRPTELRTTPPSSSGSGPAVALATDPGAPGTMVAPVPSFAPAVPKAPTQMPPSAILPPSNSVATGAPRVSGGGPVVAPPPLSPAPPPPAVSGAPPTAPPEPAPEPSPTPGAAPPPAPTAAPRMGPDPTPGRASTRIVLTEKDSGRTITVHRGQVVEVDLSPPAQPGWRWTEPQSTDQKVAQPTSGAANSDGSAYAVFGAAGDGSARVWASRMPACYFSTPSCYPPVAMDFQVTIVVTG
jgi:hypothetical protein